jgi:CRP-like cAMP-binding protein
MPVTAEHDRYGKISQLVPLNTLKQDALDKLLEKVDVEAVNRGQFIFREGDVDHVNVYLLDGRIGLYENNQEIERIEQGSPKLRFPLAHQLPRQFAARALENTDIVRIDSRLLSEALAESEEADYKVESNVDADDEDADWMTQLLQSNVMQHIPASNLQGVMMRMQEREVENGETLINEGDEGDYFYLLHRGRAAVLKRDEETGENREVVVLGAGAAFGEDALLTNNPRSSTVRMITDGIVLRLSKDDFTQLIKHPLSNTVSLQDAEKIIARGGIWVDVRDQASFEKGHMKNAINMPHSTIRFQIPRLDSEREYVVYGHSSNSGLAAAYLMLDRGLQAYPLEDGYSTGDQPEAKAETPAAEPVKEPVAPQPATAAAPAESTAQEKPEEVVEDAASAAEIADLKKQLLKQNGVIARLKERLEEHNGGADPAELEKLQLRNMKLEREIIGLTEKLESQEDRYDELKEQFDGLDGDNRKHIKVRDLEIAELKEKLTVLQLERDQAESDYEELLAKNDSADSQSLDNEALKHAQNQIEQLEALNSSITDDRDNMKYELEDARNQLSLANQEISELQLEVTDLKGRLAEQDPSGNIN